MKEKMQELLEAPPAQTCPADDKLRELLPLMVERIERLTARVEELERLREQDRDIERREEERG